MRFSLLAFFSIVLLLASCKPTKKKNDLTYKKNSMMNRFIPVDWTHSTNIYEVNVRQYTAAGTFNAFMQHLPRLKAMGVKTLWFMPVTPISEKNKKGTLGSYYACSDYTSINPEFG
ncbi:MAG: alpha-amylase family glycosyl hydrolase, partial [Chitinophagaceae bacterium]